MNFTGCDYKGHEFGAGYPDSICIDGRLWDADSCDEPGGPLRTGGEWACPRCNTTSYLAEAISDAEDGGYGWTMNGVWVSGEQLANKIHIAIRENRDEAIKCLAAPQSGTTYDWPDREAVYERRAPYDHVIERPISDIGAKAVLEATAGAA